MAEETKVRTYEPPEEFARGANVDDASVYEEEALVLTSIAASSSWSATGAPGRSILHHFCRE
jgi:hypothetical protein